MYAVHGDLYTVHTVRYGMSYTRELSPVPVEAYSYRPGSGKATRPRSWRLGGQSVSAFSNTNLEGALVIPPTVSTLNGAFSNTLSFSYSLRASIALERRRPTSLVEMGDGVLRGNGS